MIVAKPTIGQTKIKVTGLYQWDKFQTLQFEEEYPFGTEVHFASKGETVALVYLLENGSVRIPNVLLEKALPIIAWVHVGERTVLEIEMPITERAKPSDYISIEDDIQHSIEYRTIQLEQWQVEAINQMSDRYTKAETDEKLSEKADASRVYTKLEADTLLNEKADVNTVDDGLTDRYTKDETAGLLAEKASVEDVALKADKTYVDSQDALKADVEDVALKADKTYVDSQDALKADATALTALTNLVPAATGLTTVTDKNQYYPIVEDNTGMIIGKRLLNVWDGTSWVSAYANGFGHFALRNNTGSYANGFGYAALRNNTGSYSNGFGHFALENNTGTSASGFGHFALQNNTGSYSNGFGYVALANNTGSYSNGFGYFALQSNKGANNSAFGHNANNTTDATIQALTNTTCLGANTLPNKSNQVVLGDSAVDTVKMGGTARTPASSTAPGVKGETCWDTNYFYICVATDIWKRIPMEVW